MQEEEIPPLKLPRWQWSKKWVSGPLTLLGAVSFFARYIPGVESNVWLIVGIILVSSGLTIPMVIWGWRASVVLVARARLYPHAATYAKEQNIKLLEANRRLSEAMPLDYRLEIYRVILGQDNKMYVVITKREDFELTVGDRLWIIDTEDLEASVEERILGEFRVTECRTTEYYACETNVTKSWGELFRQGEQAEMMPTPFTEAIRAPAN